MDSTAKYNIGGISKRLGVFKVRVRSGDRITHIKAMMKEEHTEIDLVEFDEKMTKGQVCQKLLAMPQFAEHADIIKETLNKKMGLPAATVSAAKPKAKAAPAVKVPKQPKVVQSQPKVVSKPKVQEDDDDLIIEELKKLVA